MKMIENLKFPISTLILLTSAVIISFPLLTLAETVRDITGTAPGGLTVNRLNSTALNIKILISNVARWTAGLIAAVAVLFVIYAAYLYMTSAGDPAKVADASKYILWAIIASIVALSAFGIIALGKAIFGFA